MAASSAYMESLPDPGRVGGSEWSPACMLQLRRSVCQKKVPMIDRANHTVHPLAGHVGSAAGEFYPLHEGREY